MILTPVFEPGITRMGTDDFFPFIAAFTYGTMPLACTLLGGSSEAQPRQVLWKEGHDPHHTPQGASPGTLSLFMGCVLG